MSTHYEASMQRDIERIRSKIGEMASLCERALKDCASALRERNRPLAYSVILRDKRIDELEKEIDRLCLEFIVRQQPVAGTLRFAYSTIRINLELERVGDYAESIARQSLKLMPMEIQLPVDRLEELSTLSIPMLHDAIDAFRRQDAELARKTIEVEEAVDVLKSKLNKDLVELFRSSQIPFEALNPLMMITRRFERVSDQARNICMEVLYMCTGEYSRHQGSEVYRVLFVDQHNSCRSQLAEAIAASLNQDRFIFSSAGVTPRPITPGTLDFLRAKNLDPAHLTPKSIEQVPNLEHYHVIVALSKDAQRAFPSKPRKAVLIDWALDDPSTAVGSAEQIRAAYEGAYAFLQAHIKDLVEAVLVDED